mmetsp:Transcript_9461/g.18863  ORF Transcript_9461/g.18863 Transcript_9461/m.18863 type:complete len:377 (+) Transcript_9461:1287-2417(+)
MAAMAAVILATVIVTRLCPAAAAAGFFRGVGVEVVVLKGLGPVLQEVSRLVVGASRDLRQREGLVEEHGPDVSRRRGRRFAQGVLPFPLLPHFHRRCHAFLLLAMRVVARPVLLQDPREHLLVHGVLHGREGAPDGLGDLVHDVAVLILLRAHQSHMFLQSREKLPDAAQVEEERRQRHALFLEHDHDVVPAQRRRVPPDVTDLRHGQRLQRVLAVAVHPGGTTGTTALTFPSRRRRRPFRVVGRRRSRRRFWRRGRALALRLGVAVAARLVWNPRQEDDAVLLDECEPAAYPAVPRRVREHVVLRKEHFGVHVRVLHLHLLTWRLLVVHLCPWGWRGGAVAVRFFLFSSLLLLGFSRVVSRQIRETASEQGRMKG